MERINNNDLIQVSSTQARNETASEAPSEEMIEEVINVDDPPLQEVQTKKTLPMRPKTPPNPLALGFIPGYTGTDTPPREAQPSPPPPEALPEPMEVWTRSDDPYDGIDIAAMQREDAAGKPPSPPKSPPRDLVQETSQPNKMFPGYATETDNEEDVPDTRVLWNRYYHGSDNSPIPGAIDPPSPLGLALDIHQEREIEEGIKHLRAVADQQKLKSTSPTSQDRAAVSNTDKAQSGASIRTPENEKPKITKIIWDKSPEKGRGKAKEKESETPLTRVSIKDRLGNRRDGEQQSENLNFKNRLASPSPWLPGREPNTYNDSNSGQQNVPHPTDPEYGQFLRDQLKVWNQFHPPPRAEESTDEEEDANREGEHEAKNRK